MGTEPLERKLAAIFYADVAGYSRLTGDDEEGTHRALRAYLDAITSHIQTRSGRVVHYAGDAVLAEFTTVSNALSCAVDAQRDLKARNEDLPDERKVRFRIGVNLGEVIVDQDEIYGDGVNVAARLESLAEPGGICISEAVYSAVGNKLPLDYVFLGEQSVKNIKKPVSTYGVVFDADDAVQAGPRAPTTRPPTRWATIVAVAAVLLLAGAGLIIWHGPRDLGKELVSGRGTALPLPDRPSIAVLPFTNMSGDPKQEYFSDGITEDITTALAQDPTLFVIARNSSFAYKGKQFNASQIGQELGVQYLLEGSVQRAGGAVRITAQLIDAATGRHLWAERYDDEMQNYFALTDDVVQKIVSSIGGPTGQINRREGARALREDPRSLAAHDYFLKGKYVYAEYTKEAIHRAHQIWEEGSKKYPEYPLLYPVLGWMHFWDVANGWSTNPTESLEKGIALAQKALSFPQASSEARFLAHWLLGKLYFWRDRDFERSLAEYDKAQALSPNDPDVQASKAEILIWAGMPQTALDLVKGAMRRNPHYPLWYKKWVGFALYASGQYEEAIHVLKPIDKDWGDRHRWLAASYASLGKRDEAHSEIEKLLQVDPNASLKRLAKILPYKNKKDLEHELTALRKAGMPE